MAEPIKCPKCKVTLTNKNRLITEICGHSKCRQCLISEEDDCEECTQKQSPPVKTKGKNNKIDIIEDKYLPPTRVNLQQIPDKSKSNRIEFPSHILKEFINDRLVYLCTVCDKRFNSRSQQYYHLFCNDSLNKPYKCEQCHKTFSSSNHLKYHMDGHLQISFKCSICSKTFSRLQILRRHEAGHSAEPQQCTVCGIKLKNKESFNTHVLRHKNVRPFSCNVCEKKFTKKSELRIHLQNHTGTKQFKCDKCDKKFKRSSTLKVHSMKHQPRPKKIKCPDCPQQFFERRVMLRHRKIHVGVVAYRCMFCDTTSIRRDNIKRHIKNMHPENDGNSIKVIIETQKEDETPETDTNTPNGHELGSTIILNSIEPKIVPNSSVIRCVGNVEPVVIPQLIQPAQSITKSVKETLSIPLPEVTTHKKLKKKYDPHEIYRKILLDDDSTQENDTNGVNETASSTVDQTKLTQDTTALYNAQQSNFSETHWRKNFKYTYQIQYD